MKAIIDPISKEYFEETKESLLNKLFNLKENKDENIIDNKVDDINSVEKSPVQEIKSTITVESVIPKPRKSYEVFTEKIPIEKAVKTTSENIIKFNPKSLPDSFEDINQFDEFLTSYEYADKTVKKNKDLKIELNENKVILSESTAKPNKTKKLNEFENNPEFQNINAILDKYRYTEI